LHAGIANQVSYLVKTNKHFTKKKASITSRKDVLLAGQQRKSSNSGEAEKGINRWSAISFCVHLFFTTNSPDRLLLVLLSRSASL